MPLATALSYNMSSCYICLDTPKSPASLPCGHTFCNDCIVGVVKSTKPYTLQHRCLICREPYTIGDVDPRIVHDRPQLHISPSIRMVHLDLSAPKDTSIADCARYKAEIMSLRARCNILQWRSGVHSATIAGLTCLTRMVRDQAIQMKDERDSFEQRYNALKRKVRDEDEHTAYSPSSSIFLDGHSANDSRLALVLAASPKSANRPLGQPGRRSVEFERSAKRVKAEEILSPLPEVLSSLSASSCQ